jgi:hypothetical protein
VDDKIKAIPIYLNIILSILIETLLHIQNPGYKISATLIIDAVIWPALLVILNTELLATHIENSELKCSLFMLLGFLLGTISGYIIWGVNTGCLLKPDYETRAFIFIKLGYYFLVASLFFVGSIIISWLKNPSRS